jgi:ATP-dependent DNA ligase
VARSLAVSSTRRLHASLVTRAGRPEVTANVVKRGNQQDLVIGGFTSPRGSRVGFGALLIGYYDGGQLRYAGKVGIGYDPETLRRFGRPVVTPEAVMFSLRRP